MFDPAMPRVVAEYGVPVIVMHTKGTPKDMQIRPVYEALIPEVMDYLRSSIRLAADSGIPEDRVIIDPGIGFGKTVDHNLEIIKNLKEFTLLGRSGCNRRITKVLYRKTVGRRTPFREDGGHCGCGSHLYFQRCAYCPGPRRKGDGKGCQNCRRNKTRKVNNVPVFNFSFAYKTLLFF